MYNAIYWSNNRQGNVDSSRASLLPFSMIVTFEHYICVFFKYFCLILIQQMFGCCIYLRQWICILYINLIKVHIIIIHIISITIII